VEAIGGGALRVARWWRPLEFSRDESERANSGGRVLRQRDFRRRRGVRLRSDVVR
jgi:hypothetical protein